MENLEIHTRLNERGHFCYRVWNIDCESYITNVLSKKDLQLFFLIRAIRKVISDSVPEDYNPNDELIDWIYEDVIKQSERELLRSAPDRQQEWKEDQGRYGVVSFQTDSTTKQMRKILSHISDNWEKRFFG